MMNRVDLKKWAKDKVKGNRLPILLVFFISNIIINFSIILPSKEQGITTSIPVGWILYFIEVGAVLYFIQFINDQNPKIEVMFSRSKDFVKCLITSFLTGLFTFLWSLLFVIPGIIKAIAYSLVPMLLGDDKYKDLSYTDYITKSREMMNGHKMDFFILGLSFIGWHILGVLTLGILELWIIPYQQIATTKFLYDVKTEYEKTNK